MKNILITGASGAIGSACAKVFLAKGCFVAALYHKNEDEVIRLKEYAKEGQLLIIKADLTQPLQCKMAFCEAVEAFGSVDTVINCAGVSLSALVQDTTDFELDRIIDINIKATFYMCREAAEHMVPRHTGSIINIASIWGEVGASCESAYSMTKASVIGLTKALAKELGPSGVRVNCISPGFIESKMNSDYSKEDVDAFASETPLMKIGAGEDVAECALYLAGEGSKFVTGQIIGVNGGYVI